MRKEEIYIKNLIRNFKLRKGTKIPLVKRDPYHLVLKHQVLRMKNLSKCDSTIDDLFTNGHLDKSFDKNEQIKSIINSIKPINESNIQCNSHKMRSKSFVTGIRLPKLKLKSRNVDEQSININSISARDDQRCLKNNNNNNSESNTNKKYLSKSEKKRLLKLNSGVIINCFYARSRLGENTETIQNLSALVGVNNKKNNNSHNSNSHNSNNNSHNSNNNNNNKSSKNKIKLKQPFPFLPEIFPLNKTKINKPLNKDAFITKMDFTSKTFGKISLFGILHGIGENGSIISRSVRNFIINYFEHSDIETSLNKDNFYTILANVFLNANSFLKNTLSEHYDTTTSGTTCQLLFFPNDLTHNVYCVNAGNSKTVLYSYSENVPLSYEHYPSRPCESEYILKHGNNVNIVTRSVNAMEGSQREQSLIVKTNKCLIEGFPLSRVLGCFMWEHAGVTADPEVIEANLNKENAKVIVMGTNGLWKYLTKDIVGQIAMRYYEEGNAFAASKDLEETARMKWRKYSKEVDDITVIVIYCKWEKYKA